MAQPTYSYLANPGADRLDILAAEVHRILAGGNVSADSPYDRREIKLVVEQVLISLQGEIDRQNADITRRAAMEDLAAYTKQYYEDMDAIYKFGGTSDDHIVTLTNWPVNFDAAQGIYYSTLPASFLNLDRYQMLPGEEQPKSVAPMLLKDRWKRRYIPLSAGQQRLIQGLQGNFGFYRKGDRIEYYSTPGVAVPDKEVLIEQVLRPKRASLPDPGLLQEAQDDMVVIKAVALVQRKAVEDKKNDNNANL